MDLSQLNIPSFIRRLRNVPGLRCAMSGKTGGDWRDVVGSAHMSPQGGAIVGTDYITLDGVNDYMSVASAGWRTGFAGSIVDQASYNGSGITIIMIIRTSDIASRVVTQWENTGDNTKWYYRINSSGFVEFWNCYAIDGSQLPSEIGASYLEDPFSKPDRANRLTVDVRPLVNDEGFVTVQFSRATGKLGFLEKKCLYINGQEVWYRGTGNVVNGFTDWDGTMTFGRAAATPIVGDESFSNLMGDVPFMAAFNQWSGPQTMQANWAALAGGGNGRISRLNRIVRAVRL